MAKNSVIGSLRVNLDLDSAQFDRGLKHAQGNLASFGRIATASATAAAAAFAAAATGLGFFVKKAIDNADRMSELAQSVGLSVEALSRLGFAAKMSGTDLDGLSGGLKRLSANMATVAAGGTGPASAAFAALGVSVTDAFGSLRSSDQVFTDIAERFAALEDGASKTAMAMAIFGKTGSDLIPMLNQGRNGLRAFADQSDRTGNTLSSAAAEGANAFNDKLEGLQLTLAGVANKVMVAVLPALDGLLDQLSSPSFAKSAEAIATAIVGAMTWAIDAVNALIGAFGNLARAMEWANSHDMFGNLMNGGRPSELQIAKTNSGLNKRIAAGSRDAPDDSFFAGFGFGGGSAAGPTSTSPAGLPDITPSTDAFVANLRRADKAIETNLWGWGTLKDVVNETAAAAEEAAERQMGAMLGGVSAVASTLDSIGAMIEASGEENFQIAKGFKIAAAVIDGIGAAIASFKAGAELGGPLLGAVYAAASVAATGAQIMQMMSTSSSSTGGGAGVPSVSVPEAASAGTTINLELRGDHYGRNQVEDLIRQLVEAQGDGFRLVTA